MSSKRGSARSAKRKPARAKSRTKHLGKLGYYFGANEPTCKSCKDFFTNHVNEEKRKKRPISMQSNPQRFAWCLECGMNKGMVGQGRGNRTNHGRKVPPGAECGVYLREERALNDGNGSADPGIAASASGVAAGGAAVVDSTQQGAFARALAQANLPSDLTPQMTAMFLQGMSAGASVDMSSIHKLIRTLSRMPALHALAPGTLLPDIQRQSSGDGGPEAPPHRRGRGRRRMRATRSHHDGGKAEEEEEDEEEAAGDRTTPGVRPPVEAYSYAAHLLNGMGQLKDALGSRQGAASDGRSNGQALQLPDAVLNATPLGGVASSLFPSYHPRTNGNGHGNGGNNGSSHTLGPQHSYNGVGHVPAPAAPPASDLAPFAGGNGNGNGNGNGYDHSGASSSNGRNGGDSAPLTQHPLYSNPDRVAAASPGVYAAAAISGGSVPTLALPPRGVDAEPTASARRPQKRARVASPGAFATSPGWEALTSIAAAAAASAPDHGRGHGDGDSSSTDATEYSQ